MKRASELNYAFSVGKIRALEKFLIKEEVFEEAISSDLDSALRLFVEADLYGEELMHVKDSGGLEIILSGEKAKLKKTTEDLLIDHALIALTDIRDLAVAQKLAKAYGSGFLEDYFSCSIDMHNIKTFLRLRILNEPQEKIEKFITSEGFLKKDFFFKLYAQDLSIFINRLEFVRKHNQFIDYADFLALPIEKLRNKRSFVALEKAMHDFLIRILKPAKYFTFGPEPVLAYYFAKNNEIDLIRMIIIGKLNSLPEELLKERLNLVYA